MEAQQAALLIGYVNRCIACNVPVTPSEWAGVSQVLDLLAGVAGGKLTCEFAQVSPVKASEAAPAAAA